jgi:hypothetical protein
MWVGFGSSLGVAYGMWTGDQPISIADTDHSVRRGVEAATFTTRQPSRSAVRGNAGRPTSRTARSRYR